MIKTDKNKISYRKIHYEEAMRHRLLMGYEKNIEKGETDGKTQGKRE